MRLNNRSRAGLYHSVVVLTLAFLALGCAVFLLEQLQFDIFNRWQSALLILVPASFGFILYLRGRQIFEYDSDGEALNFKNNYAFSLRKGVSDEFPKYKLISFEVIDAIFVRRLYVTVTSKKNNTITLRYDVSYLRNKEIRDLKISLNKVLKKNKETETPS